MSESLFAALSKAQAEFPQIPRTKEVRVRTKTGGEYVFSYAPLDVIFSAVRPVLAKHELSLSQMLTESSAGGPAIETVLGHSSGESLRGVVPLPSGTASMSAQEFGSLVTYYKRYGVVSALGIATEDDDDGNHASGNTAQKRGADRRVASPDDDNPFDGSDEGVQQTFAPPTDAASEKQVKMLNVLVSKCVEQGAVMANGEPFTVEALRAMMGRAYGVTSKKELTKAQASDLITRLKALLGEVQS